MNRRSILTSLSSMLVAALAWPRKAEAMTGYGPGPAGPDGEQQFKRWNVPNTEFHTKIYNGYCEDGVVYPGTATLAVAAYGRSPSATLLPGQTATFDLRSVGGDSFNKVTAQHLATLGKTSVAFFTQPINIPILYILVNVTGTDAPTITQAPAGVKF